MSGDAGTMTRSLRVLLIEDMPDDAELVILEIERAQYTVESRRVATAEEYTAALNAQTWDVVLSDFTMPSFSGKAALEMLKARALDIPFIIVSGSVGEDVAVEVMKAGAHDFFAKGKLKRLASAIEREVRDAEERRSRASERERADIERENLLAELHEAVRARDMFLAIASHELKTPLTSLQLHVQSLGRGPALSTIPIAKIEGKLQRIARQVTRLTNLVDGLFDVLRITSDKIVLSREAVDLAEIVGDAVGQAKEALILPAAQVVVHAEHAVGNWDRLRIETVVSNLISNAAKFGQGKPIEISVTATDEVARLTISDQGIGIPAEAQARIFRKFERAVPVQHYGGLGLGLWIVRQIVEAHGGRIHIDSRIGEGSTFTVDLPTAVQGGS